MYRRQSADLGAQEKETVRKMFLYTSIVRNNAELMWYLCLPLASVCCTRSCNGNLKTGSGSSLRYSCRIT